MLLKYRGGQKQVDSWSYGKELINDNRQCVLCTHNCEPIFPHPCIYLIFYLSLLMIPK